MISDAMAKALLEQVREELQSAYVYMAISSCAKFSGRDGTAAWFAAQTKEELGHVMKFYGYLNSQQRHVELPALAKPQAAYKSMKDMFSAALKHEQHITSCIHALVEKAQKEKDHATAAFLQWFVSEQVEEEEGVADALAKLEMAGDHTGALYMLDRELGARGKG